jgi:CO dehydrogenase nickel-insertion accessory protein CooC1
VGERATPGVLRVPESVIRGPRLPPQARTILVTGKGGTGKTPVAAATALLIADHGARTLAVSTDAAHSLGDALGCPIGHDPTPVTPTFSAQEVDAQQLFDQTTRRGPVTTSRSSRSATSDCGHGYG